MGIRKMNNHVTVSESVVKLRQAEKEPKKTFDSAWTEKLRV